MRAATVVIGFLITAGMAFPSAPFANQATKAQAADEIIVLSVEGMT